MARFTDEDMKKYTLIKTKDKKGCTMCYNHTEYIDYICEGRMCSTECSEAFYKIMDQSSCVDEM